jgi:hypothetical protein
MHKVFGGQARSLRIWPFFLAGILITLLVAAQSTQRMAPTNYRRQIEVLGFYPGSGPKTRARGGSSAGARAVTAESSPLTAAFRSCINYLLRSEPFFAVVFCESCFFGLPATLVSSLDLRQFIR